MIARRVLRLAALGAVLLVTGCYDIEFRALSAPPPGGEADLDDEDRTIVLSRGTALAFECSHPVEGNCGEVSITPDDPAIAVGALGYDDAVSLPDWRQEGPEERTVLVVVGMATGETELRIETSHGGASFAVDIVE